MRSYSERKPAARDSRGTLLPLLSASLHKNMLSSGSISVSTMPPFSMEASVAKSRGKEGAAKFEARTGANAEINANSWAAFLGKNLNWGEAVSKSAGGITEKTSCSMLIAGLLYITMETMEPTKDACRASEVYCSTETAEAIVAKARRFSAGRPQATSPERTSSGRESTSAPTAQKRSSPRMSLSSEPMMFSCS